MYDRQIDKNSSKQVRIDSGIHQLLKIKAAKSGMTIKEALEGCLADFLALDNDD